MNVLDLLQERGFIYQTTHDQELREHLKTPRIFYNGFDPTGDSLHVGHLVPIMAMRIMQSYGHTALAIVGGGTARVGDPSGKTEMRKMLNEEAYDFNEAALAKQLSHFLNLDGVKGKLINNKDWLLSLNYISFLREIGVHFSINRMLTAESVKQRLEKGLSFIEFNYSILQAYDFYMLLKDYNCTIQMGGQDQWGNILAGNELCRRKGLEADTFGITFPLITNSSGAKFGKTEQGAIWIDINKTSAFEYYQFWRNTEDADVRKYFGLFTLIPLAEVDRIMEQNINRAKEILAYEACLVAHGAIHAAQSYATAGSKFGFADPDNKIETSSSIVQVNVSASIDMPSHTISKEAFANINWSSLMLEADLATSKSEARRLIDGKGVKFNDTVIEKDEGISKSFGGPEAQMDSFILRVGKKRFKQILIK